MSEAGGGSPRATVAAAPATVVDAPSHPPGHTACPRCHHSVFEGEPDGWWACDACSWSGRVRWFSPLREEARVGDAATPDDAVCVHHPRRRAEVVCAGSGAYVCPLCAVRLNGKTFDTAYVEAGGRTDLDRALQRELPRPDRAVIQCTFLPFLFVCVGPLFWIGSLVYAVKHFRLRREDPVYRAVAAHGWAVFSLVVSVLLLALTLLTLLVGGLEEVFA